MNDTTRYEVLQGNQRGNGEDSSDVDMAEFYNQYLKAKIEAENQASSPYDHSALVAELNQDHAVTRVGNKLVVMIEETNPITEAKDLAFVSFADFKGMYMNRKLKVRKGKKVTETSLGEYWLESPNRREYKGICFNPGGEPKGYYNLWRGLSVKPKEGDCRLFKKHMKDIICAGNDEKFDFLWKWCAHLVQRPWELPEVAIVMRSAPGTGKNTFVDALGALFGPQYAQLNQNGLLCGRFTAHLMNTILVFANEAVWGGDKSGEGRLKAMITDPAETVEGKGKDAFAIQNFKRIIIASNEDWAVPVGIGDRRFFCLNVAPNRIGDSRYFAAIHAELDSGGLAAFLHELLETNIEGWHPRHAMPKTGDGEDMKLKSLSSPLKFLLDCLIKERNVWSTSMQRWEWEDSPEKALLHDSYMHWCDETRENRRANAVHFYMDLRRACDFKEFRPFQGKRQFVFPPLKDCRKQFRKNIAKVEFDND